MCNLVSNFVSCTDLCNIDSHVQTKTEISAIYEVVIYDMSCFVRKPVFGIIVSRSDTNGAVGPQRTMARG